MTFIACVFSVIIEPLTAIMQGKAGAMVVTVVIPKEVFVLPLAEL